MSTQQDPPSEVQRIGAWCLLTVIAVGTVAFLISAVIKAMS